MQGIDDRKPFRLKIDVVGLVDLEAVFSKLFA
jgi:hypothetical protein